MKKSPLQKLAFKPMDQNSWSVVKLLIKDHQAMRKFMEKIKSPRSDHSKIFRSFTELVKLVESHMKAEEKSLLHRIKDHEKFGDEAEEGIEEHRIHKLVIHNIRRLNKKDRKITQIKIFCEFLEHHLDEEEKDLFPKFKKYAAISTEKKMGTIFLKKRMQTERNTRKIGALAHSTPG